MRRALGAAALLAGAWAAGPVAAQPLAGQPLAPFIEEVPFITTPDNVTVAMLELAGVSARDVLLDLGSGDGRIVITAARRFGARGLGVEIVPDLVEQSRRNARQAGVADRAEFREQDLFKTDLGTASVITMYLLPAVNLQLRPSLLALKPGTRLVSHDWDMGDWTPDRTVMVQAPTKNIGREKLSRLHLWVVPAPAEGLWCGPQGLEWPLRQQFQMLKGQAGHATDLQAVQGLVQGTTLQLWAPGAQAQVEWRAGVPSVTAEGSAAGSARGAPSGAPVGAQAGATGRTPRAAEAPSLQVVSASGAWASWLGRTLHKASGDRCPP